MIIILLIFFVFNATYCVENDNTQKNLKNSTEKLEKKEVKFDDIFQDEVLVDIDQLKDVYREKAKTKGSSEVDQEKVKAEFMNVLKEELKKAIDSNDNTKVAYLSNQITLVNLEKIDNKNENRHLENLKAGKRTWCINTIQAAAILICIGTVSALTKLL